MVIGLMGAPVDSENLGCMALTYSLLRVLQEIEEELHENFIYIDFDNNVKNPDKLRLLEKNCGLRPGQLHKGYIGNIPDFLRGIRHFKRNWPMFLDILKCDLVIDITQGDSFSDIYGVSRYRILTNIKLLAAMLGKPLVLAPQTYGPFLTKSSRRLARKALKASKIVFARDEISQEIADKLIGKRRVILTTDLAFQLPYEPYRQGKGDLSPKKIGLNFSGLLLSESLEKMEKNFEIRVDYWKYATKIIEYLIDNNWKIFLIPHVGLDKKLHDKLAEVYPDVKSCEIFDNPIEIKSFIASMDVFIGARMHGTIGAFSAGVACIPTAYSRKFLGVYSLLNYPYVVDLSKETTEEAYAKTVYYLENVKILKIAQEKGMAEAKKYANIFKTTLKEEIVRLKGKFI